MACQMIVSNKINGKSPIRYITISQDDTKKSELQEKIDRKLKRIHNKENEASLKKGDQGDDTSSNATDQLNGCNTMGVPKSVNDQRSDRCIPIDRDDRKSNSAITPLNVDRQSKNSHTDSKMSLENEYEEINEGNLDGPANHHPSACSNKQLILLVTILALATVIATTTVSLAYFNRMPYPSGNTSEQINCDCSRYKEMREGVISIIRHFTDQHSPTNPPCWEIRRHLNARFGSPWQCLAGVHSTFGYSVRFDSIYYVRFTIDTILYVVYRTNLVEGSRRIEFGSESIQGKNCVCIPSLETAIDDLENISKGDKTKPFYTQYSKSKSVSASMVEYAKRCTTDALDRYDNAYKIARHIRQAFEEIYEPDWHCAVGTVEVSHLATDTVKYITLTQGTLNIVLFKA